MTINQVSEELGVRYILDGSIQRSKDRLRFNVQLVDAVEGNQMWADRFDRALADLFVLQDDIVRRILVELQVRLTDGEYARIYSRKTNSLDAWLLYVQASHEGYKLTRAGMSRARELYEAALKIDPDWPNPLEGLSWTYWWEARYGWTDDPDEWMRRSLELAEKAVELAPDEPGGYKALSHLALSRKDYEHAIAYREKALTLSPNDFSTLWGLGGILYKAGEPEQAINILKRAMRLNPTKMVAILWTIADAQVVAGNYEDAIETSNRAAASKPDAKYPHIHLAAAYSATGRFEESKAEAAKVMQIDPKFNVNAWMKSRLLKNPDDEKRYSDLLLLAGLPENRP